LDQGRTTKVLWWPTTPEAKHGGVGKTTKAITSAALALVVGATLAAPASARPRPEPRGTNSGGSERITMSGTCDAGSRWTLSGRSRFLRIEVEGLIDAQRRRKKSRWVLRLEQNQNTVAVRSKRGSGGGLKVRARVANQPGPDTFTLTALNRTTGETCQGTLTF
jgi:hypothetical protein